MGSSFKNGFHLIVLLYKMRRPCCLLPNRSMIKISSEELKQTLGYYILLGHYIIYYICIFYTLFHSFLLCPSPGLGLTPYLFRSLCVSPSSFFSLCCRRRCRAVGVTLGGGGQEVSWRSSDLLSPVGFTQKTCCSTTERIVVSRKLGRKKGNFMIILNLENYLTFLYKMIQQHNITCCIGKVTKSTYFTTSSVRWTGDRRSLKEEQVGRRWITATEDRWSLQVTEQRSENPLGSPSRSRRSRNPTCTSELFLHLCTISRSSESDYQSVNYMLRFIKT